MLSRRPSSVADLVRTGQAMRSASRSHPELAAKTRQCHLLHPLLTAQKVKMASLPEATLVSLMTSLSVITSTRRMSWRPAIPNIHNTIPRWITIASLLRRFNHRLHTPHQHSATILNLTVAPSPSICRHTPHLQLRASTATTPPQDSVNPPPAQLPATITMIWKMGLGTATICK